MRKIFLRYMPPGNAEAMLPYRGAIQSRVPMEINGLEKAELIHRDGPWKTKRAV